MQHYIDWGLFALGLFIGIVGTASALLAFVVVEFTEYKLFKDIHQAGTEKGPASPKGYAGQEGIGL